MALQHKEKAGESADLPIGNVGQLFASRHGGNFGELAPDLVDPVDQAAVGGADAVEASRCRSGHRGRARGGVWRHDYGAFAAVAIVLTHKLVSVLCGCAGKIDQL